ncbi:ABC transporter substrate-binding protein [Aurantiacibacter sp. MUD61]|uniref:ABC transporter substrate-binding protein n=1 Tax=Aurantiacibacter sp. MUD61 TaxID=3009083 RepID=UPI0022F049EF|nr:ABC transporter substrate-binding protein [Aurantiacibacter sp. MUD61]
MRLAVALLLTLAGCSQLGTERASAEHPTIVSLNPCADAILAEITAPGQLLAISHYSHDPSASSMLAEDAARYASTGGTAEEVIALSPDMVVGDIFMAPATRRAFEQAGIRVETIGIVSSVEESAAQIEALGAATGNDHSAAIMSVRLQDQWEGLGWQGERIRALLIQQGDIVPGEQSLAHAMLENAGFSSLSAARGLGQGAYLPLEQVLADPPQVVIAAGDTRMLEHPVLSEVGGVERHSLDSSLLYCGGPTIPRALQRLLEIRRQVG